MKDEDGECPLCNYKYACFCSPSKVENYVWRKAFEQTSTYREQQASIRREADRNSLAFARSEYQRKFGA